MESTWQCPEHDDDPQAKVIVKNLLKQVREKILAMTRDGEEVLVRKVFGDFDTNNSDALTIDEVTTMIAKLQISVERKYVRPFFKCLD